MLSHSSGKANTATGGSDPTRSTGHQVLFLHAFNRLEMFSKLRLQKGKVAATNSDHSNQSQATVLVWQLWNYTDCRYWLQRTCCREREGTEFAGKMLGTWTGSGPGGWDG